MVRASAAENAAAFFRYCREQDPCVSLGFVDPQHDRRRPNEDFEFLRDRGALHVINAPSPAATASLAIGEEIARSALELAR